MEFIINDYKGRNYKVHCVEDYEGNYENGTYGLWCMVYRTLGIANNPWDYGKMEYEEDYSADFVIHPNECDCSDDGEVEKWLNEKFNDKEWMDTWVELYSDRFNEGKNKKEIVQALIEEYRNIDLDNLPVAIALYSLSKITEKMANFLTENYIMA